MPVLLVQYIGDCSIKQNKEDLPTRLNGRDRGKIKDESNNEEDRERGEGGTNTEANRLKVSVPHFTTDQDFMMCNSTLVLYLLLFHPGFT